MDDNILHFTNITNGSIKVNDIYKELNNILNSNLTKEDIVSSNENLLYSLYNIAIDSMSSSSRFLLAKKLIKIGFDPHKRTSDGYNLLYFACSLHDFDLIEYCIKLGIDINEEGFDGESPLSSLALKNKNHDKVLYIINKYKQEKNPCLFNNSSVFKYATDFVNYDFAEKLIDYFGVGEQSVESIANLKNTIANDKYYPPALIKKILHHYEGEISFDNDILLDIVQKNRRYSEVLLNYCFKENKDDLFTWAKKNHCLDTPAIKKLLLI